MAAGLTIAGDRLDALADFLDERLAADVARSRDDRACCSTPCSRPAASTPTYCDAIEAGGPYGAGWPGAARRRRPGRHRQGGCGRQRAMCA